MTEETKKKEFDALSGFATGGGQYIKFDDSNEPIEGLYVGYFIEDDPFNPGRQRVNYQIEIDQQERILASGSKRLAKEIAEKQPTPGSFIKITRVPGETQYDTTFTVETSDIPF